MLDLSTLEQWYTSASANCANLADPYSLTETRSMEGYTETFEENAGDAEMKKM